MNPEITPEQKKEEAPSVMEITTSEDILALITKFLSREFEGNVRVTMNAHAGEKTEHWNEFEYPRCARISFPEHLREKITECVENYKKIYDTAIDIKDIADDK